MTAPTQGSVNIRLMLDNHLVDEIKAVVAEIKKCEGKMADLRTHEFTLRQIALAIGKDVDDAPPPAVSRPVLVIADQDENAA